MSNFDDIFSGQNGNSRWSDQPFDKEAWAAKKQEERKELYALADSTAAEISGDGEKYRNIWMSSPGSVGTRPPMRC